jgi:hypothetical protein
MAKQLLIIMYRTVRYMHALLQPLGLRRSLGYSSASMHSRGKTLAFPRLRQFLAFRWFLWQLLHDVIGTILPDLFSLSLHQHVLRLHLVLHHSSSPLAKRE